MRTLMAITLILTTLTGFRAKAQDLPQPSPKAMVSQRVGLTDFEVNYSRPGVKERVIFGDLVPYDKMWRTGANKATSITISDDIIVAGKPLKAGTYALFTIPGKEEWQVIFNSNTEQWGTYTHKDEEDVLKVMVKPSSAEFRESMQFYFDQLRNESANLVLHWEKLKIEIPITVSVSKKAEENIKKAIEEAESVYSTYRNAARYNLNNGGDVKQALQWAQKSVDMNKKYWNLSTLAEAQYANGMTKEAIKSAEEAVTLSEAAKSDNYIKSNKANIEKWKAKK